MSKSLYLFGFVAFLLCVFTSCEKLADNTGDNESNNSQENSVKTGEIDQLLNSEHSDDLARFLSETDYNDSGEVVSYIESTDTESSSNLNLFDNEDEAEESISKIKEISTLEKTLRQLEDSSFSHQQGLEKIRLLSLEKDERISYLESENASLLKQIELLEAKFENDSSSNVKIIPKDLEGASELNYAIQDLKSNYDANSKEVGFLKAQNQMISEKLENIGEKEEPIEIDVESSDNSLAINPTLEILKEIPPEELVISTKADCTLSFDAVVTSLNGKSKEAFYTEFFIVKKDLNTLLVENGILLSEYSKVTSYGELFARARKNPFLYPNVLKEIRNILLEQVSQGNGVRVRTDINGSSTVKNLDKAEYFVIGSASLGKVGVTWSVPVELDSGMNKLSLTLSNASWSY